MRQNPRFARGLLAGGAVAIMILGALCEARLRGDLLGAIYVLGLIVAGLAVIGLDALAPSSAARGERARRVERGRNVDEVLGRISNLVRDHAIDAAGYSDRLQGASQKLSQLALSEPIDEIVLSLIKNNQDMQGKMLTLSDKLDESRTQIIQLQSSLAKAEEFGLKDGLTGIGNRRYFDSSLADEVANALDHGHDLCLFIADLDHFKRINDGFGHVVGDTLLKIFAELLTSNLKGQDRVARYGGEEFAVLFPRTRLNDAVSVAEQIRRQLEAKQWVIGRSGERVGTLTASFGLAKLRADESGSSLVQRADAMLYKAKARGRNRVEADDSSLAPGGVTAQPARRTG